MTIPSCTCPMDRLLLGVAGFLSTAGHLCNVALFSPCLPVLGLATGIAGPSVNQHERKFINLEYRFRKERKIWDKRLSIGIHNC